MNNQNAIENTFIACRTTTDFKDRLESYGQHNDLTISQIVRRGVKLLLENEKNAPASSAWRLK